PRDLPGLGAAVLGLRPRLAARLAARPARRDRGSALPRRAAALAPPQPAVHRGADDGARGRRGDRRQRDRPLALSEPVARALVGDRDRDDGRLRRHVPDLGRGPDRRQRADGDRHRLPRDSDCRDRLPLREHRLDEAPPRGQGPPERDPGRAEDDQRAAGDAREEDLARIVRGVTELALTGVAVAAVLYWLGSRGSRGTRARRERQWRAQAFYAGLVAVALAISPPLDGLADRLFWWHMVQHALLQMVAPPLIVLGAPWLAVWRPVTSLGGRRRVSRWLVSSPLRRAARLFSAPAVAWVLFLGPIWLSHLPAVFDFAARHPLVHETEHLLFLGTGLLFWSRVLDSPPFRARLTRVRRF